MNIDVKQNGNVSTVYNVGKIKKDTLPSGKIISTFSGSTANSMSKGIIPNSNEKINTFSEKKFGKFFKIPRRS